MFRHRACHFPPVARRLTSYYGTVRHVVVKTGIRTGITVLMDDPREVGTNRIMNALAAATLYNGASIIVDFGRATTFDVVSGMGTIVGGAIAPGIEISQEALSRRVLSCAMSNCFDPVR